jgi:hypothetical protein
MDPERGKGLPKLSIAPKRPSASREVLFHPGRSTAKGINEKKTHLQNKQGQDRSWGLASKMGDFRTGIYNNVAFHGFVNFLAQGFYIKIPHPDGEGTLGKRSRNGRGQHIHLDHGYRAPA